MFVTSKFFTTRRIIALGLAMTALTACGSNGGDIDQASQPPLTSSLTTTGSASSASTSGSGSAAATPVSLPPAAAGANTMLSEYTSCLSSRGISGTTKPSLSSQQINDAAAACESKLPPEYRKSVTAISQCVGGNLNIEEKDFTAAQRECLMKAMADNDIPVPSQLTS